MTQMRASPQVLAAVLSIGWQCGQEPGSLRQVVFKKEAKATSGICNQSVGQLSREPLPSPLTHFAESQHLLVRAQQVLLRGPAHPQSRVQKQIMGRRKAEARLLLHLLSTGVPVLPRTLSPTWNGTSGNLASALHSVWGLGWGTPGMVYKQGPLPGVAEALLGHRQNELSSCPFNLEGYLP